MRRALALLVVALLAALAAGALPAPATAQGGEGWKPVKATLVVEGIQMPVDIAFQPDGKAIYYVELLSGGVQKIDLTQAAPKPELLFRVEGFNTGVERGVFGLALDPDYPWGTAFYVSYSKNGTAEGTTVNVLSRFVDGKETVLLERPGNTMHNGGRILLADGWLWLTTGDTTPIDAWSYEDAMRAQDPTYIGGKVLRLTKDGEAAPGNPWGNEAWTKGHRNVYGIAYDPVTKRLYVTENGSAKEDEVNLLVAGADYGWPTCEGPCDPPRAEHKDPIAHYEATVGPTGATWFRGAMWFGTFNHGNIHRVTETSPGAFHEEVGYHYGGSLPRILDVEAHPDQQSMWFVTWSELWRLDFAEDPAWPAPELPQPPTSPTGPTGPSGPTAPTDPTDPTNPDFTPPTDDGTWLDIPAAGALAALAALALVALARRRA